MTRLLTFILLLASAFGMASAAGVDAVDIVDKAAREFQKAGSLHVKFTMTADGHKSSGEIILSGDRFKLTSPQMTIWYDGKTQWAYNPDIREVNISEPTAEELAEINPFVIISMFRNSYTPSLLKSAPGTYRINLLPKSGAPLPIGRAIVTFSASDYMPADIAVTTDDGHSLAIHIESLIKGKNYPRSTFVFNKELYPKAEIVDLR